MKQILVLLEQRSVERLCWNAGVHYTSFQVLPNLQEEAFSLYRCKKPTSTHEQGCILKYNKKFCGASSCEKSHWPSKGGFEIFFTATQVLFLPQLSPGKDSAWEASARWCGQRQRSPELPAFTEKEWKEINQVFRVSHCSPWSFPREMDKFPFNCQRKSCRASQPEEPPDMLQAHMGKCRNIGTAGMQVEICLAVLTRGVDSAYMIDKV